jgi:hypothetical protein
MQTFPAATNNAGFPVGHVGIGPMFTDLLPPQNRLHMNAEDHLANFLQVSNASGTGQGALDGLHIGYPSTTPTYLTAMINQKENDNLVMLTNQGERLRVSHIGNISVANMNPGSIANNITRVSISHDPLNPVTRPLSLLHLGYNTGGISSNPLNTDGWRSWMDIGMFVTNNTDNVYIGLKNENGIFGDRQDAVLSWGDNQTSALPPGNGPDNFRFIFTSSTAGSAGGTTPATGTDGLEGMRLTPTLAKGVYTGIGGEPTSGLNLYSSGTQNPNNTLEVNSWGASTTPGGSSGLRFTDLNSTSPVLANPGSGVLSVDANGDVIYVPGGGGGAVNADNGLSTNGPNPGAAHLGQDVGAAGNPANVLNDREVPLNTHNIYFTGQDNIGQSALYVGFPGSSVNRAKVNVLNTEVNLNNSTAGVLGINRSFYNNPPIPGKYAAGVEGISDLLHSQVRMNNIGGKFTAEQWYPIGVLGTATNNNSSAPSIGVQGIANSINGINIGGSFNASTGSADNTGVTANASGAANCIGVRGQGNGTTNSFGGYFFADGATNNYGVYSHVTSTSGNTPPTGPNYAGYFNGDVYISGSFGPSDQNLKQDIDSISDALEIISKLRPKSFNYKHSTYPSMNLPVGKQYGLIAQDVEAILPDLVNNNIQPARMDSAGNEITASVNFKGLEYQQIIPFLIKGMQEQQTQIKKQDSLIQELSSRISYCCSSSANARNGNSNLNQLDIELSDKDAIVLNQNVPNPFAEQTTITYNVPVSVEKAQLLFFNANGQVIQTVDIKTRGKGKVNVFASDLSSGLYHYTLVADGKVVDSKKMVRE